MLYFEVVIRHKKQSEETYVQRTIQMNEFLGSVCFICLFLFFYRFNARSGTETI